MFVLVAYKFKVNLPNDGLIKNKHRILNHLAQIYILFFFGIVYLFRSGTFLKKAMEMRRHLGNKENTFRKD
jgi:hypothetical protein